LTASLIALLELVLVVGLLVWFGVSQLRAVKKADRQAPADADRRSRRSDD
jgi:threonine/homoserine/homoserine lactone efflux protein